MHSRHLTIPVPRFHSLLRQHVVNHASMSTSHFGFGKSNGGRYGYYLNM